MGLLESKLFKDIPRLQDCAVRDMAHVVLKSPRERGAHVGAIQRALQELDDANISVAEIVAQEYGVDTAKAVVAYKEKRNIRRPGQAVADNIVGTGTIRKMDEEWLNNKQGHGRLMDEPTRKKLDICMSFEGGTVTSANTAPNGLALRVNTPAYLETHLPLKTFDFMTHYLSRVKITNEVLRDVGDLKRQCPIDRILIRGFSSGGKIALMVANGLFTQLGLSCRYLCVGDAALDKGDPLFAGGPGVIACHESINFYQLWGNDIDPSGEVHGPIAGFKHNVRNHRCERVAELAWQKLSAADKRTNRNRTSAAEGVHYCSDSAARAKGMADMDRIMLSGV